MVDTGNRLDVIVGRYNHFKKASIIMLTDLDLLESLNLDCFMSRNDEISIKAYFK